MGQELVVRPVTVRVGAGRLVWLAHGLALVAGVMLAGAVWGAHRAAAAVLAVAVVVIPVADIGLALAAGGAVGLHLPYLAVMAGTALAYLAAARQAGG